jgi:hypothetical protein
MSSSNTSFDVQAELTGNTNEIAEALAQPEPEPAQPESGPSAVTSADAGAITQPEIGTEAEVQPEGEAIPETEEGEEPTPEGEEVEGETADDWLPDEQEKEFSLETLARYAERYGYSLEQLQNDANLQRLVLDSLNGEIALRDRATTEEDYIVEESDQAQPVMTPEQQQQRYAEQREHHTAFVGDVVGQVFDEGLVKQMGLDLFKSFGVDMSEANDPDTKALIESAPKVGQTLARHMVSGVYAVLPHLLLQPDPNSGQIPVVRMLEAIMPNITGMWERSSYQMQWVRAAHEAGGELPAYGTPEFTQALEAAAAKIPNFDEIVYRDAKGNVLRPHEQAYRKYQLLARQLSTGKKPATRPNPAKRQPDRLEAFIRAENSRGF